MWAVVTVTEDTQENPSFRVTTVRCDHPASLVSYNFNQYAQPATPLPLRASPQEDLPRTMTGSHWDNLSADPAATETEPQAADPPGPGFRHGQYT